MKVFRRTITTSHEPVLGTVAWIQVTGRSRAVDTGQRAVLQALDRYEGQFSLFRADSELSRWRRGEVTASSERLLELLTMAATWQTKGLGALNPAVGEVAARWARAEREQMLPSDFELDELAQSIAAPRFAVSSDRVDMIGDCSQLTFHSFAKGLIVDWVAQEAFQAARGVESLLVNVGGDLRYIGHEPLAIGIENPLRAYDNEPPLCTVSLVNESMATSGGARRGWTIDGLWYSHVIDPRTARPVSSVASASVVARKASTADAIATVLSVLSVEEGLAYATSQGREVRALIIDEHGTQHANASWLAAAQS